MTETIFSPSFGNRPSYLVGRGNVISTFISGLEQEPGNRDRAMLMLGQRGSGKTVLLWELADRARKLGFVVATPTVASEDMLERIVEKIQEAGEPYVSKRHLPKLSGGKHLPFQAMLRTQTGDCLLACGGVWVAKRGLLVAWVGFIGVGLDTVWR